MNRIFRIIWSKALRAWVVASELATLRGKGSSVDKRVVAHDIVRDPAVEGSPWLLRLGVLAALLALYAPVQAADRYWDANGTGVGLGGVGIWNTTDPFWSPNSDGVSGPYSTWNNAALDDAFFGGTTTGTVTLGGPITVHNITLGGGYTLAGSTLTLGGVAPTISVASGSATISSAIAGSAGLTKADGGNLFLTGTNTFTGNVNVNGGRLDASGNAALGNIANIINMATGTRLDVGSTGGGLAGRTVSLTGNVSIFGSGAGSGFFTGGGNASFNSVALSNNLNNYTGRTSFSSGASTFTSIADLGMVSSLGAPTTAANGVISVGGPVQTNAILDYVGDGDTSNRDWQLNPPAGPSGEAVYLRNGGTGTLTLTGNIALGGGSGNRAQFQAISADMELLGVISSSNIGREAWFVADAGRTLRLGDANTFGGRAVVRGAGQVVAGTIANSGVASSLGAGSIINVSAGGTLSYTGTGASSDRNWQIDNGTLNNNGSGALTLSGPMTIVNTTTLGGSFTGADNIFTGVISGTGNLRSGGAGTWVLTGTNTYTGNTVINGGVLRAGTAAAFGASTVAQVNGGTLDLNGFDRTFATLSGTGGTVALGSATLTLDAAAGTSTSYAGSITGSGGLTKLGASTQTLTGANTYTGDTTLGGGTLNLNFGAASAPDNDIISSASTLNMSGGTLNVNGAAGENNTQTFDGLNITAGNNTIDANSGSGGSMTVNLGAVTRTGGLMNFNLPGSGNITTTNLTLGGWATVNGTDYAKVEGGNILAFEDADYTDKDNAGNWLDNEFITDVSGFFGTVNGSVQLGGLRYTQPVSTTVTVNPGETLGVDGTIIVAPSVLNTDQVITGGMLTGANGGVLGIQQNSTGTFFINSQIVDNGSSMGFVKAGTGGVALGNANNSYTGATQVVQGTLSVNNIGNGGVASNIGASSADSANLVLEGATLRYTSAAATTTSDRGFTIAKSGGLGSGIEVTNPSANLTFTGLVTSPDDATFTKSGPGTLTLANGANDYVGGTIVTGGLLSVNTLADGGQVSGIGRSSSASANLVLDGGGLQYTGATATTNRGMTLGLNDGTIDVADGGTTLTVSGTVTSSGGGLHSLFKEGDGTLVLSGTNTYVGFTTVNGGVLRAGSTQAFGQPNISNVMTLANAAGVTLDLNNFNNFVGPLNGGGANGGNVTLGSATLRIGGGGGNYSGAISGTGGILRTNGGTQIFNGCNNTYTGATTLEGANLQVDCLADGGVASGIGASSNASSNLVVTSSELNYTGATVSTDRGMTVGTGAIRVNNVATTLTFGGQVVGDAFIKRGAGTLVLGGPNTYTSYSSVEEGTLRAGSTQAFGTGGVTLSNVAGATLDLNGFNNTVRYINGGGAAGGNVQLGAATLTISDGVNQTYDGAISGSGGITKNGGNAQAFSNCNSSYTGVTTINAGTLAVNCLSDGGTNSSMGASSAAAGNLILNGGTLRYDGAVTSSDRLFTLGTTGGTLDASGSGALNLTNSGLVALTGTNTARTFTLTGTNTGNNTLAAQLNNNGTGASSLTKTGTGTWVLTNNNSNYTGVTTILGGVLGVSQLANGGVASGIGASSNAASNLVIGNGSTLRYTGDGDSTDRLFTLASGVTFIESSGTGAINFANTGAVTLAGTNTARTIALGGTNTGDNIMGGTIGNNGTGATTLAKNDSGTWILTGNNTYTGNTVVNDGNLIIGNGGTTGNAGAGNVIVDSPTSTLSFNRSDPFTFSGTLSGPGSIAQIGTGTTILTAPNNSIGATSISAGTLQVNGVLNTATLGMTGTSALTVNGTLQTAAGTPVALTGDAGAQTITLGSAGILRANGSLGDGADTIVLGGTLDTGTGTLDLAAGDDTLVLNDGGNVLGAGIAAGSAGIDTLQVNNALALSIDGANVDTFEILNKTNTGLLTLTGDHSYAVGTTVAAGTLDVDGTLTTPTLAMGDGTTLDIDGAVQAAGPAPTTLTGSAGVNTVLVNTGASLSADGDLGGGSDVLTLAGALDTGAGVLNLGDGDDTFTLNDGAVISGVGVDGGGNVGSDSLVLNNALGLVFDGSTTAGFESLLKQNSGTATMTGSQSFSAGTTIAGGALTAAGDLTTPTVAMADGTTLNVDGTLQAGAGTAAVITGSTGANTVTVAGTAVATGDLGTGNDVLDVAGTLDTDGGTFFLGDGDDSFTVHDGSVVLGTVDGGAGMDTRVYDINLTADLGALTNFEGVTKTGTGTLNINGPGATDLQAVDVLGGTLNVAAGASVVATVGSPLDTVVANGATLNVDGSFGCGTGNDTMTVAGTVSGSGTIDLCGGDDTLTLNDGVVLAAAISGGTGTADTVVLDTTGALTFDATNTVDFELLQKNNTGIATLTGSQSFIGGTTLNGGTLDVDGTLETPAVVLADDTTLNVDGTLQAGAGTAAAITGSTGTNTVSVGAGGTLLASGDLGTGDDVLDIAGTLDTDGGTFFLGDGADSFVVHDGSVVLGTIDGGAGLDTRVYDINLTADLGTLVNFEGVTKTGTGTLNINGPGATDLQAVEVLGGTLNVAAGASVVATAGSTLDTVVANGATLNVDGSFGCGAGNDTMSVSGTVSGSGTIDLCDGDDTLTLNDGAVLATAVSGGAGTADTVVLNNANALTFDASNTTNFEVLQKDNTGTATLTGTQSFSGGVLLNAGTLDVDGTLFAPTLAMADDTVFNVDGIASGGLLFITGSAGTNTVVVGSTGALTASGGSTLGAGDDVLDVAGSLDVVGGPFELGDGADTLVVHENTAIVGGIDAGNDIDLLQADIAAGTASLDSVFNFESLEKLGLGTLQITGLASFLDVDVQTGTLEVTAGGSLSAQTTTVAAGSTLLVNGSFTGTAGGDVLDVAGTLDIAGGTVALGDGDDTFTIHDGTNVIGTVDGGAGMDSRVYDINLTADLGALVNFEGVTKTGTGTLNINGPGATDLQEVEVLGGTLNVAAGASVVATAGSTLATVVASGATLNVDGSFGCGAGNDTMNVSGTVSGGGTIDLCDGEDTLTLNDGAVLATVISGGAHGTGDTVVLNNANALTFDASNTINFEVLQKDNTGTVTLTGTQSFIGGTLLNGGTLDVDGTLETPTVALGDDTTLNVDGTLQAVGGTAAVLTGSAGANTVSIGAGGTLLASGDLGAGNDVLDVTGTLDTGGGTFALGDGDDTLTIHDGTNIIGTVAAGAGNDTFNTDIATSADLGAVQGFETLSKTDVGVLNILGPMSSDFITVNVLGGTLNVTAGGIVSAQTTTVAAGSTLQVDGVYTGTAGADVLDVAGTLDISGGTLALGDGDDTFTIHDGTNVIGTVDGGAGMDSRVYDINLTADLGALVNFEGVTKTGTGTLNINGPGATDLQEVEVLGGTLNIGAGASVVATTGSALNTVVAGGATLNVDGSFGCGASNDTMNVSGTVSGGGTIDQCGGEDTLTLNDGAVLNTVISGGAHGTGDTVVLNNANALTFDATNTINYEFLQKDNTGTATLTGTQSFIGGTTLNAGTLTVAGTLDTPAVALADDTTLNVDGTLQAVGGTAAAITGSAGANTVAVTGMLLASGDLGAGNDVLDVAGTLNTLGGTVALGDGDDTLTIHDGTDIIGTVLAGAGNDTFNADIATSADLGAVQGFETLSKTDVGVLDINGPMPSDFTTVNVLGGTLNVTAGGSVTAQNTTVAAGSTLQIDGRYEGTAGNDSFTSAGTVRGALAFGNGNDRVDFHGGDLSGLTGLDGGTGSDDRLSFHGMSLDNDVLTPVAGWERVNLLDGSELALDAPLDLSGGLLSIDATSQLIANAGASLTGDLANSGLITVGGNRFGVNGDYTGGGGLALTVLPAGLTSGGLDISGDVVGTTAITFASDGSQAPPQSASILVISSPNDDPATAGGFTPAGAADGLVRLNGSVFPWTFGQQAEGWYLNAETNVVLPEIGGYAILPSIGQAGVLEDNRLLFQRLSGVRGDTPYCGAKEEEPRAYWKLTGDCHGFWMAARASELEMGADPGFAFSGDSNGLYVGADVLLQDRETRTFRGGLYAGFQRGNYWTTGDNSTGLQSIGVANVRTDTPTFGMYGSVIWRDGTYVDTTLVAQIPKATIAVAGGFEEEIRGNSLTLSTRIGHRFYLDNDWTVEPQAQLSASAVHWQDKIDTSGKQLAIDDGLLGVARAAVRTEKVFETEGGARIRPWATLGLQDTIGEDENALVVASPGLGADAAEFSNHQLGLAATIDLGLEAELNESVSLFGVLSYDKSVDGSDSEQRQANLGVRIRW